MEIKPWDEVLAPDPRTLHFLPGGLGMGMRLSAEGSADFQQHLVAALDLAPSVAEGTRRTFERLREAWVYGALNYDLFTIISDAAWLVYEQALRDVFLDHHQHQVTFVDVTGQIHTVEARQFDQVFQYAQNHTDHRLQLNGGRRAMEFDGGFTDLRRWARRVGLLRGQRVRSFETGLGRARNDVAHRDVFDLGTPVEGVRTLTDLREWINQLWGMPTEGGKRFPAPITREVVVVARERQGPGFAAVPADELHHETDVDGNRLDPNDDWEYVIARAVLDRPATRAGYVDRFDSLYEVTPYPAELLWGPGTREQARQWLVAAGPLPDQCDMLDRVFALRHDQDQLWRPMRPDIAAGLPPEAQGGQWHLIRADFPDDAFLHVRSRVTGGECRGKGLCPGCGKVESLLLGVPFARAFSPTKRSAATSGLPDLSWHAPGFLAAYERSQHVDMP